MDFVSSCLFQTVKLVLLETRIRKSKSMLENKSFFLLHLYLFIIYLITYFLKSEYFPFLLEIHFKIYKL